MSFKQYLGNNGRKSVYFHFKVFEERSDLSWSKAMVSLTLDELCCLLTAYQKFRREARDAHLDLQRTQESAEEEEIDEPLKKEARRDN